MGRWQAEYEREWAAFARETLRAQFGRGYARHRVTTSDKRELRDVLRAMGSCYDPFTPELVPVASSVTTTTVTTPAAASRRGRRSSAVRFQTPRRASPFRASARLYPPPQEPPDDANEDEAMFPATQVLTYTQMDEEDDASGESGGNTSDTSMQSDVSYVYHTPQPAVRRVRQRSPAAAVSSAERQHKRRLDGSMARSSTSTFPAFTPRDLHTSRDLLNVSRLSTSAEQKLRRRLASMSPIAAARLRFSIESALLNESRTTIGDQDESSVLLMIEATTCVGQDEADTGVRTPQPIRTPRLRAPATDPKKVVDLDVSMQSLQLDEDEVGEDDAMDGRSEKTKEVRPASAEDEGRKVAAVLDFKDMSDDDDEEEHVKAPYKKAIQPRTFSSPVAEKRWHWSETTVQGESESVESSTADAACTGTFAAAPVPSVNSSNAENVPTQTVPRVETAEQDVIEIDDDMIPEPEIDEDDITRYDDEEMCAESEVTPQTNLERQADGDDRGNLMSKMLKNRLRNAGLAMSDEEDTSADGMQRELNPFDSSTASANKGSPTTITKRGSPTASSSSSSSASNSRKLYYRTKLPLQVESTNTHADDRRRERRQKLRKKLASIPYVFKVPECNVDLAPYQREAVDWMLAREQSLGVTMSDGRSSTARQREIYYDRLTSKMRGGILADEMGLGKTICCIALICESLKRLQSEQSSESSSSERTSSHGVPRLKAPTLIITPLSILSQWEKEIREKTNLSVISYQGHSRRQIQDVMDFMGVDIVLSTYDTLRLKECKVTKDTRQRSSSGSQEDEISEDAGTILDQLNDSRQWRTPARRLSNSKKPSTGSKLHQLMWHRVILDESHLITNPSCARAKAALILKSKRRWCVTGTPIQNSGKDLTSLMTFLGMSQVAADLDYHEVLSRVMLRRLKSTVDLESDEPIVQLPEKQEEVLELEFATDLEKAYYTLLHRSTKRRVFEYLRKQGKGTAGQFMHVFELLLRLRQCCDDCSLISDDPKGEVQDGNGALLAEIGTLSRQEAVLLERASRAEVHPNEMRFSTKIKVLLRQLREMKENGERGLVVSQWTSFLDLIGDAIHDVNARNPSADRDGNVIRFCRLDGGMSAREREQAIASFQVEKRVDVMLVSIRTGGLGLNLTAASQVFIMEPSWNPSIESQAIDRAHRVGQKRRVRIVRFLMKNTIEERVVELQRKKRELATTTLGDDVAASQRGARTPSAKETALTRDELHNLFSQEYESGSGGGQSDQDDSMESAIWNEME